MKKNLMILACASTLALGLSSCAAVGTTGIIYTGKTDPFTATSNRLGAKVGESKTVGVLGLVAVGNGGIQKAAQKAGITKISTVDTKTTSVLGIFTSVKTIVTGD